MDEYHRHDTEQKKPEKKNISRMIPFIWSSKTGKIKENSGLLAGRGLTWKAYRELPGEIKVFYIMFRCVGHMVVTVQLKSVHFNPYKFYLKEKNYWLEDGKWYKW